jgi:hypothetical protein
MSVMSALLLLAALAQAPAPTVAPAPADSRSQRLSQLAAARDYVGLGALVTNPTAEADARTDLDWMKVRLLEGDSAYIAMLYAKLLWMVSDKSPPQDAPALRETAAMALLYAHAAIAVDGTRCGDRSAPSRRQEQLMAWQPAVWPFIAALPPERRQRLVDVAVAIEQRTAARRDAQGDVEFLCRYGMEETSYNLAHGRAREVPTPRGGFGRTVELKGDGKFRPSLEKDEVWRPRARSERASLRASLSALVDAMAAAGPAPRP